MINLQILSIIQNLKIQLFGGRIYQRKIKNMLKIILLN